MPLRASSYARGRHGVATPLQETTVQEDTLPHNRGDQEDKEVTYEDVAAQQKKRIKPSA